MESRRITVGIIDFQDASFSYDGHANALDGITLSVERGSFVCVLGGNGSGKSTLARHIDALLLPDSGKVCVLGLDTADGANLLEIRSNAGLVFQNPDDQIVAAVVEDDVAFGPENLGVPSEQLPGRVQGALDRVGLGGFGKRETFALSGGQKQRVAIAGALAMHPKILVLDEASAMLDPCGREGLMRLLRRLNDAGMTVVYVTHFMDEAAQADRVVVLDEGRVAMGGAPSEVLTQARRLRDLALEVPFATHMSIDLQDLGVPVRTCIEEDDLEQQLLQLPGVVWGQKSAAERSGEDACVDDDAVCVGDGATCVGDDAACVGECDVDPSAEGAPVVTLDGVSFSYVSKRMRDQHAGDAHSDEQDASSWGDEADSVWALRDVSFSLREGDFLGIAGHTGSGKSTLAQLMAGLLQPTEGAVLVRGLDLADKRNMRAVRSSVGMVFQYPERQLFASTVFDDVAFGPRNLGLSAEEAAERVRMALRLVHLDPDKLEQRNPFELSGGQQRRVALAGVLAMQPSVLILDEPAAGLDPKAHRMLLDLIAEFHDGGNVGTVMVSHNMDDLAYLCNRVMLLNRGEVVADGDPASVFSDEAAVRRIGLGAPHTVRIANRLGMMGAFEAIPTPYQLAERIAEAWRSANASRGDRMAHGRQEQQASCEQSEAQPEAGGSR